MFPNNVNFERRRAEVDDQMDVDMAEKKRKHSFWHMRVVGSLRRPGDVFILAYWVRIFERTMQTNSEYFNMTG